MTRDLQTSGSNRAWCFTRRWPIHLGRLFLVILFLVLGQSPAPVTAAPNHKSKVAPDLEEETRKGSPAATVRLIVTLEGADADSVARKVAELGGTVRGHFHHVQEMVLEVPLDAVEELAATDGVRYLTPDREVSALTSQLDATSGADVVFPRMLPPGNDGTAIVAPVVVDSTSSAVRSGVSGTTLSWSHTVGSGPGRLLVVGVSLRD